MSKLYDDQEDAYGQPQWMQQTALGQALGGGQSPVQEPPSVDYTPVQQPPSIDYTPERQAPSIDYTPEKQATADAPRQVGGQQPGLNHGYGGDVTLQGQGPQRQAASAGSMPAYMHGFDANNWNNGMNSVKYRFGHLAANAGANTPSKMAALAQSPEFLAAFPGATFNGKDMMNFNGALSDGDHGSPVGMIDVLEGADPTTDSANGVWWGWDTGGSAPGGGGGGSLENVLATQTQQQQGGSSTLAQMMALLQKYRAMGFGDGTEQNQQSL